jgi:hypothetical protein
MVTRGVVFGVSRGNHDGSRKKWRVTLDDCLTAAVAVRLEKSLGHR